MRRVIGAAATEMRVESAQDHGTEKMTTMLGGPGIIFLVNCHWYHSTVVVFSHLPDGSILDLCVNCQFVFLLPERCIPYLWLLFQIKPGSSLAFGSVHAQVGRQQLTSD